MSIDLEKFALEQDIFKSRVDRFFKLMDTDKDGVISRNDYVLWANRLIKLSKIADPDYTEKVTRQCNMFFDIIWGTIIKKLKLPGETVTIEQFEKYMSTVDKPAPTPNLLTLKNNAWMFMYICFRDLFKLIDRDRNGAVSYDEFRIHLNALGVNEEKSVRSAFLTIDTNGDGVISVDEFCNMGCGYFNDMKLDSPSRHFFGTY